MAFLSTLLISMFVTMALIPILRAGALRLKAGVDLPAARKVHDHPVPKVGGLAMAVAVLVPMALLAHKGRFPNAVLAGALIIVAFGLLDDLKNLGWKAKFAGQAAAALVVILYGGLKICLLGSCLPEGALLPDAVAIPLTLLVIVGVTNAINLSDGLDGLAGGTTLIVFMTIGFLGFTNGDFPGKLFALMLCTSVVGALFGFLRYNTHPATVFMGDTGSQLLGFLAVTLALGITQQSTPLSPLVPLLLLGFPVLDTLCVMAERISRGRLPFSPDKNHFHHKLMRLGLFHTEAVVAIYAITAALALAAIFLRYHSEWLLIGAYLVFSAAVIAAFTALEKKGFRLSRTGFFDLEVKGRLKGLKELQLPIRFCFPVIVYGLPLYFLAACLLPAEVPGAIGALAAGGVAAVVFIRLTRRSWTPGALRIVFYPMAPFVLALAQGSPADWAARPVLLLMKIGPGLLALFTVLTLKLTRRQKGFKPTTLDFLIILIALVVPNLPEPTIRRADMGALAAAIIALFFGFEVLLGELRGDTRKLTVGLLLSLGALSLRSLL
jgi:UDP-GlcNAc:undecaprenyl-phosphate GlcNAc-1-phosphate transferase